jgi:hypothetical protein
MLCTAVAEGPGVAGELPAGCGVLEAGVAGALWLGTARLVAVTVVCKAVSVAENIGLAGSQATRSKARSTKSKASLRIGEVEE